MILDVVHLWIRKIHIFCHQINHSDSNHVCIIFHSLSRIPESITIIIIISHSIESPQGRQERQLAGAVSRHLHTLCKLCTCIMMPQCKWHNCIIYIIILALFNHIMNPYYCNCINYQKSIPITARDH